MGEGDREAQREDVPGAAAPVPDRVRRHDRLSVAGSEGVQGAQHQRDQERQGREPGREVVPGHQGREAPGEPVGAARQQRLRPAAGRGVGERRPARPRGEGGRPPVGRGGEHVLRVGGEAPAAGRARHVGRRQRHPVAPRGDLPPADAALRAAVPEGDRPRPGGRGDPAFEPQRRQPRLPARRRRRRGRRGRGHGAPVHRDAHGRRGPPAGSGRPIGQLGRGRAPVAVGVHVRHGLRGRDLREVLDVVDAQFVRGRDEPVVAVDGEVAQGMRGEQPGGDQGGDHGVPPTSSSAAFARGAHSGENRGLRRSAPARSRRAAARMPSAFSMTPRWKRNRARRYPVPVACRA